MASTDDFDSGGLSMRKMTSVRRVLSFQERTNDTESEGDFLARRLRLLPEAKVANDEQDVHFGGGGVFDASTLGYQCSEIGRNGPLWRDEETRKFIWGYCPEFKMVADMKHERERCTR